MRVLLVQLPHATRVPTVVPIGIGNISTAMREAGCETEFLDLLVLDYSRAETSAFLSKSKWDMIGISAFSTQYEWAKWFATEARKRQPHAVIVMGGPLPTFSADTVLQNTPTDICVLGEGEETIKELVLKLGCLESVAGITYRTESGRILTTAPRPYIRDLDSLPFTSYDLFDMDIYFKHSGLGIPNSKSISILTSRGCPYNCNFCSRTFRGVRLRSVGKIVEEIGLVRDKYGIRGVGFNDELVLVNKERGYLLCEQLKPLKIYWQCQGRANIVDLDLLKAMREAGCVGVGYGIESGSQKILDAMNKKTTVKQNELAVSNTLKAGMLPIVQMIYGYPGEDMETISDTVKFFKRVKFYPAVGRGPCEISLMTPLPGSPLYSDLMATGKIGNEEQYLLRLAQGYNLGAPMLMNLTKFTDNELLEKKSWLQDKIKNNYISYKRLHPAEWFRFYFRIASICLAKDGLSGLVKTVVRFGGRQMGRALAKIGTAL